MAAHRVACLSNLEGVADRGSERLVHVGQQARHLAPGLAADRDHRLGKVPRIVDRLHERAVADLDVEHDRLRTGSELLRHDRGGDQRGLIDRRRHVAQPVQQLVGRHEVGGLPDDRHPDLAYLSDELVQRQLGTESRDRLELVERPARVAEPTTAHLSERNPAGGHDRPDGQRRLVADAAGRVLVDHFAAECAAQIDRLAASDHRVGQRVRLGLGEAPEVHRHAERGQLVVGNLAAGVAEDQLGQLLGPELLPVALALDQLGRADHFVATNTVGLR